MSKINPSGLVVGELVWMTVEARYVGSETGHSLFKVPSPDGEPRELWLPGGTEVDIVRVASPQWPPQQGDVWEDASGQEWFAVRSPAGDEVKLVLDSTAGGTVPEWVAQTYGPMALSRRRDDVQPAVATADPDLHTDMHPQPGEPAAAPVPAGVEAWTVGGRELVQW